MRVVLLIAGITLLATGVAAIIGRRADVGEERDRRLEALLRTADRAMYMAKVHGVAHHLAEGV